MHHDQSPIDGIIHPRYLPYSVAELAEYMPPVAARRQEAADSWIGHFTASAQRDAIFRADYPDPRGISVSTARRARQVDKDERFWIATATMRTVRADDARERLVGVLHAAFGDPSPFDAAQWSDLVTGPIHLFLEANLPSPTSYQQAVAERIEDHPVAYLRDAAHSVRHDRVKTNLEGPTNVDALIVVPDTGLGVVIEAKVLSDISHDVTFDPLRNQIARSVDVMLESNDRLPAPLSSRRPDRSVFLLVTPEVFRRNPTSRFYGWLMDEYRHSPDGLKRDLSHREPWELGEVHRRVGWVTWEQLDVLHPGTCPWLHS